MDQASLAIDRERQATAHRRWNIGCGAHPLLYWTNVDSDATVLADVHVCVPPLPLADASLDEIYAGHFLEHLTPEEAEHFLAECRRVLVPGGRLGIVVPDTREIMSRYLAGTADVVEYPQGTFHEVADLDSVCRLFVYSTVQETPHRWSYDAETLRRALERAGFHVHAAIDRWHDPRIPVGAWYQCGWDAIPRETDDDATRDDVSPVRASRVGDGRERSRGLHVVRAAGESEGDTQGGGRRLRILFGWPSADFSISDVARGYRRALARQGHDIHDFELAKRLLYHARALGGPDRSEWVAEPSAYQMAMAQQASEMVVVEALRHQAELVVLVSGLMFHPCGLTFLRDLRMATVVIHTESPYEDIHQLEWNGHYPEMLVFTHERISAERFGWGYLPHAYDPTIHRPVDPSPAEQCDVLFVGTGWTERQAFLEAVDWTGIRLSLRGLWPGLTSQSPLWSAYQAGCVLNEDVPALYASARVCLNLHRAHPEAVSLNPRAYEIAACGAFQIGDHRLEYQTVFGSSVPTIDSPAELEAVVRDALAKPAACRAMADEARQRVRDETFDARAAALMAALEDRGVTRAVAAAR